ncbi:MAG: ketoacyl-ACP synthase III [Anaerolineae bacterium]|jgi:3-oxoacyl-[acyl-carrier-protein] synthase III|nr:ketoacyl-ACP synthase III [Anaerolineae bacterium]
MLYAHITGWGMAVPETVRTNDDISKMVDTNDEWIRSRTGIAERRIASEDESSASLGADAALRALEVANLRAADLDLIIVASSSPEHIFPATASLIQDRIGANNAGAFDLSAACTGFIFAVNMAAQSIRSGASKNILVVGTETLSRFVDWTDRNTCILFGDGAGAFVLQANEEPGGVLAEVMHSDGSGGDLLSIPAGGSKLPATEATLQAGQHLIQMDGKGVFRFATRVMARATKEALEKAGLEAEDLDLVIPHQANTRIIEAAARGLKLPMDKFMVNLEKYGNTSTASVPIATVEAFESGRIKPGDKIVLVGFGGGLTWGALVAEWTGPLPTERKVRHGWFLFLARIRSVLLRIVRIVEGMLWGRYGRK